jgi:hypothetical protein
MVIWSLGGGKAISSRRVQVRGMQLTLRIAEPCGLRHQHLPSASQVEQFPGWPGIIAAYMHSFRLSFRCMCLTYYVDSSVVVCLGSAIGKDTKIVFFGMLCSETSAPSKRTAKFGGFSPSRALRNVESRFAEKPKRLLQSYDARHESERP